MTRSVDSAVTDSATPLRAPRTSLLLALATLALVIVVGGVWAISRIGPTTPPAAVDVMKTDDHAGDASHAAAPAAADAHADGGHDDAHAADAPAAHGHDEIAAHDDATAAHDATEAAHTDGGHADAAAAVSVATKQIVLGSFAGVNGLALVAAAILRRRYPPRLPKHLQR